MATRINTIRTENSGGGQIFDGASGTFGVSLADGDAVILRESRDRYTSALTIPTIDLASLTFEPGFLGEISGDTPLAVEVNNTGTGLVTIEPGGRALKLSAGDPAKVWAEVRSRTAAALTFSNGTIGDGTDGGWFASGGGSIIFAEDVSWAANSVLENAGCQIHLRESAGKSVPTLRHVAGTTKLEIDVATLNIRGGADSVVTIDSSNCTPTAVNIDGGVLELLECGTITALNGSGGVVDFSRVKGMPTLTATALGPGVIVRLRRGQTYTATADYAGGPRIVYV